MAASTLSSRRAQPEPEINVTPLVDVVLVLLIIFMVIAPDLEKGQRVELPSATAADEEPPKEEPITVTLTPSGDVFLEKAKVSANELATHLSELHAAAPGRRVVVKGDATVPYDHVRALFATVQKAGFLTCSLVVGDKARGGAASASVEVR